MTDWLFDTLEPATEGLFSWLTKKMKPKKDPAEPMSWENSSLKHACDELEKLDAGDSKRMADVYIAAIDSRLAREEDGPWRIRTAPNAKKDIESEINEFIEELKKQTSRTDLIPKVKWYNSKGRWLALMYNPNRASWIYATENKHGKTNVAMTERSIIDRTVVFYIRDLIEDGEWAAATEAVTWSFD